MYCIIVGNMSNMSIIEHKKYWSVSLPSLPQIYIYQVKIRVSNCVFKSVIAALISLHIYCCPSPAKESFIIY